MPPFLRLLPAVVASAAVAAAQGDSFYTVSSLDGMLRRVDPFGPTTLSATQITTSNGRPVTNCNGLAREPATGVLFAIVRETAGGARLLATLDPSTAFAAILGPLSQSFAGLAFRADGTLFAVSGDGSAVPSTLWTLNPATAQATVVLPLGNGTDGEAIAFAPDGFLYHASGLGVPNIHEVFERIDTTANSIAPVTLAGFDADELTAMTSYAGGNLLATDRLLRLLVLTTAGQMTRIGMLDHGPVKGIAFVLSPDSQPYFRAYGDGCAATSGRIPLLGGSGTPGRGNAVQLQVRLAPPGSFGALVLGTGTGTLPVPSPACQAQIAPLAPGTVGFVADGSGAFTFAVTLPPLLPVADYYLQTGHVDGNALLVGNPLQMHVR
jgi:hypothetical protein